MLSPGASASSPAAAGVSRPSRLLARAAAVMLGLLMPLNLPFAVPTRQDVGLGWSGTVIPEERGGGVLVTQTTWAANASGLLPGDRVLRVGDRPASPATLEEARQAATGEPLRLLVSRDGELDRLEVPVSAAPPGYSAYRWFRFLLAIAAWLAGMALLVWRGEHTGALALGSGMLLVAPVTLAVEVPGNGWILSAANTLWQLQAAAYRFFFPALLLHFLALQAGRPAWLRARVLWVAVYAALLVVLFLSTDGFQAPLAWRRPGAEQDLRTAAGLLAELAGVAGCVLVLRSAEGLRNSLRWLAFVALFFLLVGIPLSTTVLLTPGAPAQAIELLRQVKSLLLLLLVAMAALYLIALGQRQTEQQQFRGRLAASASLVLTGLYGFAVAGVAAITHSLERHVVGIEGLMFVAIFLAAILFSPVLRWAREMVDRHAFARWAELEARAHAFVDRIGAELEPERIAEGVSREVPSLLDVASARLVLAAELVEPWDIADATLLNREPHAVLVQRAARRRDGKEVFVPVSRSNGEIVGVLCVRPHPDGQAFAATEHAVLRTLAQGVAAAVRNAEAYFKLRRAQRELDDAERVASMGALAGGLAHEIKNPLASLKLGLYLLERNGPSDEKLRRIQRDVQRIDDLISGLLRFTHNGGAQPCEPVDVARIAEACVADIRPLAEDRGTALLERYPACEVYTLGGASQLRLVVSNLLSNALEAAGDGGVVEVEVVDRPNRIELTVRDDGPGVPSEQRSRIFDLNFSTKPGGTGLGLALARRETERLGGMIAVEAGTVGTALRVVLPRATF